jgi:hypothetical protein
MMASNLYRKAFASFGAALGLAVGVATAGNNNDPMTSLSYISYLERYATITPASQGETLDAVVNMPVLPGDRVETARGARAELQLADGSTVWMDQFTTLDFDSIANSRGSMASRTVLHLASGRIAVELAASTPNLRVDSPAGTVYLTRNGLYQLEFTGNRLEVAAARGAAELPAGMGSVLLRAGYVAWVAGGEELQRASWSGDGDDFWRWVQERRTPPPASPTARYVEGGVRAYVLDTYGEWVYVDDLGSWGWRPRVTITWVPYRFGRWYWTPTGWCWVSYEPWGWYPYHYGSWYFSVSFGWVWFWDPVWAPAWVHWIYTPGYVGWCPRGYYDWWWWHHGGYGGHHRPHRWSEVSFDFSGRVRLGAIDRRPWTFVPEDRFTSSHIERVRLDPERVLQTLGPEREAIVRSGPLTGPSPREVRSPGSLRDYFGERERSTVREVTPLLRREPLPPGRVGEAPPLRRTADAVREVRPVLPRGEERVGSQPTLERPAPGREREQDNPGERYLGVERERLQERWERGTPGAPRDSSPSRRPSSWLPAPEERRERQPLPPRRSLPGEDTQDRLESQERAPAPRGTLRQLPAPAPGAEEPRRVLPRGTWPDREPAEDRIPRVIPRSPSGEAPRAVAPPRSSAPPPPRSAPAPRGETPRPGPSQAPSSRPSGGDSSHERPRHRD